MVDRYLSIIPSHFCIHNDSITTASPATLTASLRLGEKRTSSHYLTVNYADNLYDGVTYHHASTSTSTSTNNIHQVMHHDTSSSSSSSTTHNPLNVMSAENS